MDLRPFRRAVAFWEAWGVWLLLPALSLLVAGDVALRYFFNLPLQWGSNVKGLLLILVMTIGLAGTSLDDQHIRVVLFDEHLSAGLRRWIARARHLLTGIVALAIAWAMVVLALDMFRFGDRAEMIAIPLAPVAALAAFATALSALAEFVRVIWPRPPNSPGDGPGDTPAETPADTSDGRIG